MAVNWTARQVLFCLVGSSLATICLSFGGYQGWKCHRRAQILDEKNRIVSLVQTGPEKEALKTAYLAELLGLSVDEAVSVYEVDCKRAQQRLLCSPLIKSAKVKKMPPSALYIDYEVRKPQAILGDYKNVAIDKDGFLFPIAPFFSPKEIPEIYLGLPPFESDADAMGRKGGRWCIPLENEYVRLALEILKFLEGSPWQEGFRVKRIDVSNAFAPSLGQREIVLLTEEEWSVGNDKEQFSVFPKILRLATKDYAKQLEHFFVLRRNMEEDYRRQLLFVATPARFAPRIIDLRIPQLAFVQNHNEP